MVRFHSVCLVLIILFIVNKSDSLIHKAGTNDAPGIVLHQQNLFNKNSSDPQNYTVAYEYRSSGVSCVINYVQLNISGTQDSRVTIDYSKYADLKRNRYVYASARIQNVASLRSSIEIRGMPGFKFDVDEMNWLFEPNTLKPRSFAFICNENGSKHWKQKEKIYEFGTRSSEDVLIHFRKELVAPQQSNRATFNFENLHINITYVTLVSNSPWAIVFNNKILITDHRFRATVYGLNKETFSAEMFIFGKKGILKANMK